MEKERFIVEVEASTAANDGNPSMGPVYMSIFAKDGFYRADSGTRLLLGYFPVTVVTYMVNVCNSMRCYNRATSSSSLAQFSYISEDSNDSGDCEELARKVVQMFKSELKLKTFVRI